VAVILQIISFPQLLTACWIFGLLIIATESIQSPSSCQNTDMAVQTKTATFAAGCFWGVEHYINRKFKTAIKESKVGYSGGKVQNPSYQAVCQGNTGHAEAVQFKYNPEEVEYKDLVEYFFRIHDPTTKNRQGNDQGTQYRSAIFYHDAEQQSQATEVKDLLQKTKIKNPIVTEIVPFENWWDAEEYHQKYLVNNPGGYCNHGERW
jgi:peptide-methionine (S)-S-oxide reductase